MGEKVYSSGFETLSQPEPRIRLIRAGVQSINRYLIKVHIA